LPKHREGASAARRDCREAAQLGVAVDECIGRFAPLAFAAERPDRWTDEREGRGRRQNLEAAEILRRYDAGERDFRGLEIESPANSSDPEFRGANVEGSDLSGCFIVADFSGARLRGAKLSANVKTCCFDRADLRDADFSGAAIDSATFDGADLEGATFEGAAAYGYTYVKGELSR